MAELSNAHKAGALALLCAGALVMLDWRLACIPVGLFLLMCGIAPFMYGYGFFLPVISRGRTGRAVVALTFDDGPDPVTTPRLLALLAAHGARATFFVIGQRAAAHPELVREILARGHTIGNHSHRHDPFAGFKGARRAAREIEETQALLLEMGIRPLVYRPPVGITYPSLRKILARLDLVAVNFSCRGRDRGNRAIDHLADRILGCVRGDDIVMLHDHLPDPAVPVERFIAEVTRILEGLQASGLSVRPLEEVIGRPVNA